jgi:UDP-N-acetylglucosamine/UDP-N-acetylgalactosamine diphosphorylase
LEAAGASIPEGIEVELAPAVSYAGEGLEAVKGKKATKSGSISDLSAHFQ